MWVAILLLAATVLGAGAVVGIVPAARTAQWIKPMLAFSGAYLFALTITHLLPEALALLPAHPHRVGYWVLAGFFGQLLLEVLSEGIEHGHVHAPGAQQRGHVPLLLLGALMVHSLLEGSILVKNEGSGEVGRNFYAVVLGVALHHLRPWRWLRCYACGWVLLAGYGRGYCCSRWLRQQGYFLATTWCLSSCSALMPTQRCWALWRARFCTYRLPFCSKPAQSTGSTGPSWVPP
jgi:hypothetical protein